MIIASRIDPKLVGSEGCQVRNRKSVTTNLKCDIKGGSKLHELNELRMSWYQDFLKLIEIFEIA